MLRGHSHTAVTIAQPATATQTSVGERASIAANTAVASSASTNGTQLSSGIFRIALGVAASGVTASASRPSASR
ncbi:hypothetical protein BamMEX5DRAFT_6961 [Burkholderia ambifaria MEX-5]|uniref:Uncharacterized protein n=1 Tax=Burkholderia ambifaria MEX-5 TaxID=396597 RepID=B1TGP5_9BURK|nr:hypothetical protein BamMEX5DRAFT_6961 [Burkholderia ambifaria MEX-5]